ncbi:MAG: arsenate reductase (thioredoxin) [Halorhodospira sp.]
MTDASVTPLRILFLCTGNSCRSQMAEGFARHLGGPAVQAGSAGIEAHGLNPRAVAAMAEVGIDISAQASSVIDDAALAWPELVVTVCGHADEHCPMLPPGKRRMHWPLPDPARATGEPAEVEAAFRQVRDEIHQRVRQLLVEEGVLPGG